MLDILPLELMDLLTTHYCVGFTFQTHNLSSANTMMKQCKCNAKKLLGFKTKNNSL